MDVQLSPMLKDEEVQMLIDWLNERDTLGESGIKLTVTVIERLMADRRSLAQTIKELGNV